MTIEPDTFKEIMATAPGPVAIVTSTDEDGAARGLTVSAVCEVSIDPVLVLACLDRESNTLAAVERSGGFTINYLAGGHDGLARRFAQKSDRKFDACAWEPPADGVGGPVLHENIAAYAACRVHEIFPAGDHVIVIGEVVEGDARPQHHAMAYARRSFFTAVSNAAHAAGSRVHGTR